MRLEKLTLVDGDIPVYINPKHVTYLYEGYKWGEGYTKEETKVTVILFSNQVKIEVKEDIHDVRMKLS